MNKRQFLKTGTGAGLGLLGSSALGAQSNRLTREEYQVYLDLFNANDPRFIEFYHPDVVLELGDAEIVSATGIRDFYANVKQYIKEEVTLNHYIADEGGIAVEIPTRFECIADWPDSFWGRPLETGMVLRIISFGFYEVVDRKFSRVKSARYKVIHDWRQEPA